MVLHGGSSNEDREIKHAVERGINKINNASDIKEAFYRPLRVTLRENDALREPFETYPDSIEAMKQVAAKKIKLFQDDDKARFYKL